jgi:PTH2 family peptidyl-tRNA hydrolase
MFVKQAIIIRDDLKLSKGKTAAQACHACLGAYKKAKKTARIKWELEGTKKVILKCSNLTELKALHKKAKGLKIAAALITDAGRTEIPAGTITALGLGPAKDELIDKVTGSLKLLQ